MGNCCSSSEAKTDNFSGPGRTLGAAPDRPQNAIASVPKAKTGGQTAATQQAGAARTLGGNSADSDAKAAAARAAEVGSPCFPSKPSSFTSTLGLFPSRAFANSYICSVSTSQLQ